MPSPQEVSSHYTHGHLVAAIQQGMEALGKTPASVTTDDLAPIDEFHIGGREASRHFLDQLGLPPDRRVLDIGCGLGGPARFAASRYRWQLDGIDLTAEYVETGQEMCKWVRLGDRVALHQGSALSMPFGDGVFDGAYMIHVGMNIEDKARLCTEAARVLKRGAPFGIYDIMKTGSGDLTFPVPWATTSSSSVVVEPEHYRRAMQGAGFTVTAELNRHDFAIDFFDRLRARTMAAGGPPPLGLHILMGRNAPEKIQNMVQNVAKGLIAPVEIIARKE